MKKPISIIENIEAYHASQRLLRYCDLRENGTRYMVTIVRSSEVTAVYIVLARTLRESIRRAELTEAEHGSFSPRSILSQPIM